ncbi:hypothetical protein [Brevibacillus brevis]|uniref:Tetratricopeptide repeat protein n=1 Tax=Brevibacillus brevis TaxID=1393 RepID=A0ABY9T675_BREBE|nr:hypothetical protein [Brevibacillus brevis]WNC13903.1 hypothetical protein RGB73_24980 [Brevibacillus brevis]
MGKWLLVAYYVLAVVYVLYSLRHREAKNGLAAIVCFVPFAGLPLALVAEWRRSQAALEDTRRFELVVDLQKDRSGFFDKVDLQKETSIVPIEEALLLNDFRTRRRIVLDMLKDNSLDLASFLAKAVRNEDSETSHYAVTAMLELKRQMMAELQRAAVAAEQKPDDIHVLQRYAEIVKQSIENGLFDPETERTYSLLQADVLERLIAQDNCMEEVFIDKIDCEIRLGRYEKAEEASKRFIQENPQSEMAFYMAMKLYYTLRAGTKFNEVLESLKRSTVKVSPRTLQLIRYWNQGV